VLAVKSRYIKEPMKFVLTLNHDLPFLFKIRYLCQVLLQLSLGPYNDFE
jgi:hypothetical protein